MKLPLSVKRKLVVESAKTQNKQETQQKQDDISSSIVVPEHKQHEGISRPNPAEFAALVAREIVKNLSALRVVRSFSKDTALEALASLPIPEGKNLMLVDTSVLIDGRILPVVNSGFISATLLVPKFVLGELQHIADSSDSLRRAKGRRGLDIVQKLMNQKANDMVAVKVINNEVEGIKEVDHKLKALAKQWKTKLLTVDFNLAQIAKVEGVKVLNLHDLAQAVKLSIIPGEELYLKITHEGKERQQGVGYLSDGTMVVVDGAKEKVGIELVVVVSRVVNTPAGQLFFARLK